MLLLCCNIISFFEQELLRKCRNNTEVCFNFPPKNWSRWCTHYICKCTVRAYTHTGPMQLTWSCSSHSQSTCPNNGSLCSRVFPFQFKPETTSPSGPKHWPRCGVNVAAAASLSDVKCHERIGSHFFQACLKTVLTYVLWQLHKKGVLY